MQRFSQLFRELDQTTRTSEKLAALVRYFREADDADAVWALHFLLGRRGRRPIKTTLLRDWVAEESSYPIWLVEECYDKVGDLAETLALLLEGRHSCRPSEGSDPTEAIEVPPLQETPGGAGLSETASLANVGGSLGELAQPSASGSRSQGGCNVDAEAFRELQRPLTPSLSPDGGEGVRQDGRGAANVHFPLTQPISEMETFHEVITKHLLPLAKLSEPEQRELLLRTLRAHDQTGRFLFLKLLTGGFRMGASKILVIRALAEVAGLSRAVMEHRLMSKWEPTAADFRRLLDTDQTNRDPAQPYPFYLASPIEQNVDPITDLSNWQAEWKWDGIRAQLIRRDGQSILWSRGEELVTHGYPEIGEAAAALPDGTVLDGEILAWRNDAPLPFTDLQKRLGRKNVSTKIRQQVPVIFIAYDLLESDKTDIRQNLLADRRRQLETTIEQAAKSFQQLPSVRPPEIQGELFAEHKITIAEPGFPIRLSPLVEASDMDALAQRRTESRSRGTEGIMLKRRDSAYGVGRERGAWWKWKIDPYTVDAVLIAAQPGHGKRAGLFTDYTFGIWRDDELVSFAKAYSGLTAEEIREVDEWVRTNTTGRHGPVRTVNPELVFELAFEGIQESSRHKSGIALRFPRIARWRKDKPVTEADRIENLRALLNHS